MRSGHTARCVRRKCGLLVNSSESNSDADRFSGSRSTDPPGRKVARGVRMRGNQNGPNTRGADLCVPGAQRGVYAGKVVFLLTLLRKIPTRIASPGRDLPIRPGERSHGVARGVRMRGNQNGPNTRGADLCVPGAQRGVYAGKVVFLLTLLRKIPTRIASPGRDLPIRPGERSHGACPEKLSKAAHRTRGERSEDPESPISGKKIRRARLRG